jgi:hypothetical protein
MDVGHFVLFWAITKSVTYHCRWERFLRNDWNRPSPASVAVALLHLLHRRLPSVSTMFCKPSILLCLAWLLIFVVFCFKLPTSCWKRDVRGNTSRNRNRFYHKKDDTPQLLCVASSYTDNNQETITALASSPRQHRHHLKQMNHFD